MNSSLLKCGLLLWCGFLAAGILSAQYQSGKQAPQRMRVIVTSDGEIDDECSMVRFLLYANEWDVEGIITSSSQYHWRGHKWAGDQWVQPLFQAYAEVYPNLVRHDSLYPTPAYLQSHYFIGNVDAEGEMDKPSAGADQIVKVLLDESDARPVWLQAWGGTNTIARALKNIEEKFPDKMQYAASKMRFFFIWEQDSTYQSYIRPHWGKYNILTIISDQFEAIAYRWKQAMPSSVHPFFNAAWMNLHILNGHGPLCAAYKAHTKGDKGFEAGDFRSEGDSPAFIYTIPTGLQAAEHPDWGGWGGRYVKVRENTWLDPVPEPGYQYPAGRWYGSNGWGRSSLREGTKTTEEQRMQYFKGIWQWAEALQQDFAARADWCVRSYKEANHPPVVKLNHASEIKAKPGQTITLNAGSSYDPDGDVLTCNWWIYPEAGTPGSTGRVINKKNKRARFIIPRNTTAGTVFHLIAEVRDKGTPVLTRYARVVITVQ